MQGGNLRHRVTIQYQKPPETTDNFGETTTAWIDLATVWAQVDSTSGTEMVDKAEWRAVNIYSIRMRRRTDVTAAMRAIYVGRTFNILSISEANVPIEMTLICREVI